MYQYVNAGVDRSTPALRTASSPLLTGSGNRRCPIPTSPYYSAFGSSRAGVGIESSRRSASPFVKQFTALHLGMSIGKQNDSRIAVRPHASHDLPTHCGIGIAVCGPTSDLAGVEVVIHSSRAVGDKDLARPAMLRQTINNSTRSKREDHCTVLNLQCLLPR